jgi:hypothetical protein
MPMESSSREHPRGSQVLPPFRGVALSRGSENGKSWRRGSVWCHKCQKHLLPLGWARCHIPLGYGTGTSHEKNFQPVLTPIPGEAGAVRTGDGAYQHFGFLTFASFIRANKM